MLFKHLYNLNTKLETILLVLNFMKKTLKKEIDKNLSGLPTPDEINPKLKNALIEFFYSSSNNDVMNKFPEIP